MNPEAPRAVPTGETFPAWRTVIRAGMVVGLAIMGDSLMYNILPLEAPRLGIALPLVGVLLSANRLVRLLSNTVASALFARWGAHRPFFWATVLALITTTLYGVRAGFLVFLLARVGWGMAWSALRQGGYQAVWAAREEAQGRYMGVFWGLVRLGSATSVILGGFLHDVGGYRTAVFAVAALAALALPLAWGMRWPPRSLRREEGGSDLRRGWRAVREDKVALWVVAAGFIQALFEATLVSTAALYLARHVSAGDGVRYVGTATGVLLAVRWVSDLVFGPLLGALADWLGHALTAVTLGVLVLLLLVGPGTLGGYVALVALGLVFVCNAGMLVAISAGANTLALRSRAPHALVGVYTTAVDGGLAVGPLLAYSVGTVLSLPVLYALLAAAVLLVLARYLWAEHAQAQGNGE